MLSKKVSKTRLGRWNGSVALNLKLFFTHGRNLQCRTGPQEVASTALEVSPLGTEVTSTSDTSVEDHEAVATVESSPAVSTSRSKAM
jgi:hypothetical protein